MLWVTGVQTCALPISEVAGDINGLRLGTSEMVRFGMGPEHAAELAGLIHRGLAGNEEPEAVATDVTAFRARFDRLMYVD